MNALLAIAGREFRERWTLPLAAFCFGFVLLVPILRHGERALPVAAVAAVPAAWVVAVLMGGSVIARDLADGRLGFFFARPVPWWSIAGGKLLAAFALTIATAVAGALPAALFGWDTAAFAAGLLQVVTSGGLAINLAVLPVLIGLGHAASVVYRSRSRWAALDFALLALALAGGIALVRSLERGGVWPQAALPGERYVLGALLLLAALTLAPALVQLARGRSDMRRGHRALSLTLWSGLLLPLAVVGGYAAWQASLGVEAFPSRHVTGASSDGRYVALVATRPAEGGVAGFLLETGSGRALRLGARRSSPAFAGDARIAAWLEAPFFDWGGGDELSYAGLSGGVPKVETLELETRLPRESVRQLSLDAAAERVAVVQSHTLSVHELPSGRTLSRTAAADGEWIAAAFLRDGRLRAFRRIRTVAGSPGRPTLPGFIELVELAGGVPTAGARLDAVGHAVLCSPPAAERVLLLEPLAPRSYSLHEAATGRRLGVFAGDDGYTVAHAVLLDDGGAALVESDHVRNRLRLALDGQPHRLVELPPGLATLGGVLKHNLLSIAIRRQLPFEPGRFGPELVETLLVAIDTGEVVRREPRLAPAGGVATLFITSEGDLVRLDPATGERQVLLKAGP